jgi:asparagine synthase (glutamine-hydrolysing)
VVQGVGGDELNSGSVERYADAIAHGEFRALPGMAWRDWRDLGTSGTARALMRGMVLPLLPARFRGRARQLLSWRLTARAADDWLAPRLAGKFSAVPSEARDAVTGAAFDNRLRLLLWLVNPTLSHHLEIGERETAGLLEVRSPYLDARLVAFAASLPERLLASGSIDKRLHRTAMRGLLPQLVAGRPDKAEFSSVFWEPLAELDDRLAEIPDHSLEEWLDPGKLREELDTALRRREFASAIWRIWALGACLSVAGTLGSREETGPQSADHKASSDGKETIHQPDSDRARSGR